MHWHNFKESRQYFRQALKRDKKHTFLYQFLIYIKYRLCLITILVYGYLLNGKYTVTKRL